MQAIVIPLKVSGIGAVNVQLIALGKRASNLSKQLSTLRTGSGGGSGGYGGGGGGSRGGGGWNIAQNMNRMAKFGADLSIARRKGYVGPATESGVYQYMQAQRGMPKVPAPPATFGSNLKNALMTSRIGSGGLMPLVNKVLPLLGEFAGPLVVATAGLKVLAEITMQAADNLKEFRSAMLTGGGTASETAIGRALGDSNGEMARQFARNISQGGVAAGYAGRAGISDPGGELFGSTDKTKNLLKWADALREMSQVDALRAARATGTEDLLKVRDLSARAYGQLKATATLQAQVNTEDKVRAAANFNTQMDRAKMNFESLTNIIGSHFMKAGALILDFANGLMEAGVRLANSPLGKALLNIVAPIAGALGAINDYANPKNRESATDRNTRALEELAQVLRNGVYGGGERARNAIPHQWSGYNADQWAKQAMNLGAFTL